MLLLVQPKAVGLRYPGRWCASFGGGGALHRPSLVNALCQGPVWGRSMPGVGSCSWRFTLGATLRRWVDCEGGIGEFGIVGVMRHPQHSRVVGVQQQIPQRSTALLIN